MEARRVSEWKKELGSRVRAFDDDNALERKVEEEGRRLCDERVARYSASSSVDAVCYFHHLDIRSGSIWEKGRNARRQIDIRNCLNTFEQV